MSQTAFTTPQISALSTAALLNGYTIVKNVGQVLQLNKNISLPSDLTTQITAAKTFVGNTLGLDPNNIYVIYKLDVGCVYFYFATQAWIDGYLVNYDWN